MPILILLMIWLTTVRHESAHWLAAVVQGVEIREVRLIPGVHPELGFYFGYVARGDGGNWMIDAAPYVAAMAWFLVAWLLLRRIERGGSAWRPLFLIGGVSPLIDLAYNYQGGLWREGTDVHDLLVALPDGGVHAAFLTSMLLCALVLRSLLRRPSRNSRLEGTDGGL
jgi:hypothetical protein